MNSKIAIEWHKSCPKGSIILSSGRLVASIITKGEGTADGSLFCFHNTGESRLSIEIEDANLTHGAHPTMVTVMTENNPFTFLLRDICSAYPVFIPEYDVVVTAADDPRSYDDIRTQIQSKGLQTNMQKINTEPEESWDNASANTRSLRCLTWLGLSRDMRIFEVDYSNQNMWHTIFPKYHGMNVFYPGTSIPMQYKFYFAKGVGCSENIERRLEERIYPILHGKVNDGGISYNFISFTGLEKSPLTKDTLRGTHFLVADKHGHGNMLTESQLNKFDELLSDEINRDEETILYTRIEAINTDNVPRYAWFKVPIPYGPHEIPAPGGKYEFDGNKGSACFEDGSVFIVAKLNGRPSPKEEIAVLIKPGEKATFEFYMPHKPISTDRSELLINRDFDVCHKECRNFWEEKQRGKTKIKLPEKRVEEMIKAGLYHLDLVAYGLEPDGAVAPTIGVYCPIGSESSPIIQSMDSFGWHDLAERSIGYFLDKQHDDGFIQNFGGYMLETGAALWTMGEHYRYTRNKDWVRKNKEKFIKACDFLLAWRSRNLRDDLRGCGYGMLEGKVADPEDPFRAFMLNGYAYLGMKRVSEMLVDIDPVESSRISSEADALKSDIKIAFSESMAKSPVVPLGDGRWCPTLPPWAEARGPVGLLTDEYRWYTHGAFIARDSLLGAHYLVLQEVIDPNEQGAIWMSEYLADIMNVRNVALSQPYYSIHPYIHVKRDEVKAFLKAYYNGFAGLADRETYTFWEHYFHASPHKTHEEGWFLMQSRWMLFIEDGNTLKLLSSIPRKWLEHGNVIEIEDAATYFGNVSFYVKSDVDLNSITARITCDTDRKPEKLIIRLPHPQRRLPVDVKGGLYDPVNESVIVENFNGAVEVILKY